MPDLTKVELVSPVLRDRGINSMVAIPLIVADEVIGVMHAGSEAFAQFVEDDARLLELVADRIALAINQAALHDAERAAQERLYFLGEASALLSASLDVEETLADSCEARRAAFRRLVRRRARPAGRRARAGRRTRQSRCDGPAGDGASVVLPLVVRERTLGRLIFAFGESGRAYGHDDLSLLQELASRAAVAVDNARLYRDAAERAQATRVLASVGDGVFLVDRGGIVRTWNRAAAAATGLPAEDVVDRRATDVIPGWAEIAPRISVSPASAAAPRAESLPLDLGTRELWLSIHGVAVPDGVVFAFRDLTEERALEQLRTEFVSTVSHELRTPLAAIYGAAMTLAAQRRRPRRGAAREPARRRLRRGRPARPHGERHPLGEPARHRLTARHDPELRPADARARRPAGAGGAPRPRARARARRRRTGSR